MIINVRVTPNAKKAEVKEENDGLRVKVRARADNGKANEEVVEAIAEFYKVRKSAVSIIKGVKSRDKTIEIK